MNAQTIRQNLEQFIEEAAAVERERKELEALRQTLATHATCAMAYDQGRIDGQTRILRLIAIQLDTLERSHINSVSLVTLRRAILQVPSHDQSQD